MNVKDDENKRWNKKIQKSWIHARVIVLDFISFLWVCLVKWPVGLVLEGATAAALQELWAAS